jgi:UDP-N-acetylmuramate dehydrogenase
MVREQVALAGYTTLGLGGPAARFVEASRDEQVISAVRAADQRGEPVLVLGGGSNLVIADAGFPGTVVRVTTCGITAAADGGRVAVSVAAGHDWDTVVSWCIGRGLSGLECLSGIPGLAGATPIQNVGAYGQEVAQTLAAVRVYDRQRDMTMQLSSADCGFGYRTSALKRAAAASAGADGQVTVTAGACTGRYVVLGVTFRLASDPLSAPVRYAELARTLGVPAGGRVPLADAREAVLRLRRGKGMVLDPADPDTRSAGSFFTNPVLDSEQLAALEKTVAAGWGAGVTVPRFAADGGRVKVPAAWLIERAGFGKGYPGGGQRAADRERGLPAARISAKHTLALVNPGGATTSSLLALAREIRDGVRATFGVELVSEPVLVGSRL